MTKAAPARCTHFIFVSFSYLRAQSITELGLKKIRGYDRHSGQPYAVAQYNRRSHDPRLLANSVAVVVAVQLQVDMQVGCVGRVGARPQHGREIAASSR